MKDRNNIIGMILLALGCFALPQRAPAVSPPPDGGYPGGNTAEGTSALLSLTTGLYNTGIGIFSLLSNGAANFNTGVGAGALLSNTADSNTAVGAGALLSNTTGIVNTATGAFALFSNVSGSHNTATGSTALLHNTIGDANTAVGEVALTSNTTGGDNTAIGWSALSANIAGDSNTAIGWRALFNSTGSNNIALGIGAGSGVTTAGNAICIGAAGNNVDNSCYIGNIFTSTVNDSAVFVNSNGRLGITTSSRRFKEEIKPMAQASQALLALKPVTFRYKKEIDPDSRAQFGLVAEEVEKVNPDLVVRDKEGKAYSVRYEQVNAMLLNEFLKEHRKVEAQARKMDAQEHKIREQEATISELKKDLQIVVARIKEQDSKIQNVSDQIEINKAGPGVVRNESRRVESNTSSQ
jgi:hypothetical protein